MYLRGTVSYYFVGLLLLTAAMETLLGFELLAFDLLGLVLLPGDGPFGGVLPDD
jgi:hypothetical protein